MKASQEAVRLFGPEYVNVAVDSRASNGGKFGTIPEESSWKLSPKAAMVYFCENEVCLIRVSLVVFPLLISVGAVDSRWRRVPQLPDRL